MPLEQDAELLARFRAGDRGALGAVYDAFADPLARLIRMGFRVQTADGLAVIPPLTSLFEVESLAHDVFLRAFAPAARAAYDGHRPYINYLMRIARNLRIDQFRHDRNLVFTDQPGEIEQPAVAEDDLIDRELQGLVRAFVAQLGEPDHSYYDARYRVGGSQTQAAAACGLTRIQGRRIEARIKHGLIEHLEAHGHQPRRQGEDDELPTHLG